jgi:predicted DsbA family dithiol-disulfide isomerase
MRIDIYSDTVCPWCYLGKRRFELAVAARPQYEPRVTWRPFELNPDIPAEGVARAAYLASRIGSKEQVTEIQTELKRQGEASGIEFRFDLIERMPNTRRSHLLIAHAARRGRQTAAFGNGLGLQAAVKGRVMRA